MRAGSHQESARWRMTTTSHLRQAKAGTPMSGLGGCALASGDSTPTSGLGVFAVGIDDDELVAKIAEETAKETKRVSHDEMCTSCSTRVVDEDRLWQG